MFIPIVSEKSLLYSPIYMGRIISFLLFTLLVGTSVCAIADTPEDKSSATVFAYFNIADDGEDSSLSYDRFSEQVEEIGIGNYTVLPLSDLLAKQKQNVELPPNTIAITFDDPNADTYSKAIPLLLSNKIPFTIFVSPGTAESEEWDMLRNLQKNELVTIGLTSFTYGHLGNWSAGKLTEDLNRSKAIFRENMSIEPAFFAYPLGEYSSEFVNLVRQSGFTAAFGQASGVITPTSDNMKLPRFTMTDDFGDLERFRSASNAMPFPVKDIQPDASYISSVPVIGFTIDDKIPADDMKKTKCFSSGEDQPKTNFLNGGRIEVRFSNPPMTDRLRINCTIPVAGELPDDDTRYRWLGFLLYFPVKATEIENDPSPVQP